MTTKVTTNEVQVLKRTWSDLDPKVRNALDVWVLTVLLVIGGLAIKSLTPADALYLLVPVTLAVITGYATTSKHKELILTVADDVDKAVNAVTPTVERAMPKAAPVAAVAAVVADKVDDAVHADEATFTQVISDQETKILPSTAASFLSHLPSSGPAPILAADSH